jgi:hypothetical protein
MQHFEITYYALTTPLTYACTTIREATEAIYNLATTDPTLISLSEIDNIIRVLVEMKYGSTLKLTQDRLTIRWLEGEV